jgi:hypothetical protein
MILALALQVRPRLTVAARRRHVSGHYGAFTVHKIALSEPKMSQKLFNQAVQRSLTGWVAKLRFAGKVLSLCRAKPGKLARRRRQK